jgi:beta-xylosidase
MHLTKNNFSFLSGFSKPWLFLLILYLPSSGVAQSRNNGVPYISRVWAPDNGDGTYKNPVLHADYSDPDVIRVGSDFYLVSSSFEDVPGLPVLHSRDLVNWKIAGYALPRLIPESYFSIPRHGQGVWAPSIRFHEGTFYIYYPDPDFGIYVITSQKAEGPWSTPVLVQGGKGLIDPCPLWDEDGQVYLVHAFAGSRAGIKSILVIEKLSSDGTRVLDRGKVVYDGHELDPTVEGPKLYKRNGYYYLFAPAGGVSTGWQLVLRSKNIYGPYERRVVMDQGKSPVNGPHQGAWVTTAKGEDWFMHFQDQGVYGRVVHLQPLQWIGNWPVIGKDRDGDGKGEPVGSYRKPDVGTVFSKENPRESDQFNDTSLGLQWQWMADPQPAWYFLNPGKGVLRLYAAGRRDSARNLWDEPNLLLQKFPADEFRVTTGMHFSPGPDPDKEQAGLVVMGMSYSSLALKKIHGTVWLVLSVCVDADKGGSEKEQPIAPVDDGEIFLRVSISAGGKCQFSYSRDGKSFSNAGGGFQAQKGKWTGAKTGIFCVGGAGSNDSGYADFDWFRVDPLD